MRIGFIIINAVNESPLPKSAVAEAMRVLAGGVVPQAS